MAFRLYIVPKVGDGSKASPHRPKYFMSDATGTGLTGIVEDRWSAVDYGVEAWLVVGADLSTSDDNLIVGKADAFAIPFDMAAQLTSQQVTNVKNKLEAINVPAGWVDTSLTWIAVVREVLGMFLLMQRYAGIHGAAAVFSGGVSLSTTIGQLPAGVRQDLLAAATSMGLDTSGITGPTTLRQALKALGTQLTQQQYNFNGTLL